MTEEFLHYVWKFRNFNQQNLTTIAGESLQIDRFGFLNPNSGPDFSEGAVTIEGSKWEGNIEIHIKSSDWYAHQHQQDPNYLTVILHVVYEYDKPIYLDNGLELPTLELKGRIDEQLYWQYEQFVAQKKRLPCADHLAAMEAFYFEKELEANVIQRLVQKAEIFKNFLRQTENNWQDSFFMFLGYGFGLKVNAVAFSELVRRISPKILLRHVDDLTALEALLFGVSGLLPSAPIDSYTLGLQRQFTFWQAKYQLQAMTAENWKFSRMRPAGFPTRKIALFAALLYRHPNIMHQFLDRTLLPPHWQEVMPSTYWNQHYNFGKPTPKFIGGLSENLINNLQINVQFPFLLHWATENMDEQLKSHIFESLERLPKENNATTRAYALLGFPNSSAFHSQGIIALQQNKCTQKRCLYCAIGVKVMDRQRKSSEY